MRCVVCRGVCEARGNTVTFRCCGHVAHRKCVGAWLDLPWDGDLVCPKLECRQRCKPCTTLRVQDLPEKRYLVIDPTCDHCAMLMHEVGPEFATWEYTGMQAVENTPKTRFADLANEDHFPHTFIELSTGLVAAKNGVAEMFWTMAQNPTLGINNLAAEKETAGTHKSCTM